MAIRKRFTLLDLLVVIAIIGFLIALTLPARTPNNGPVCNAASAGDVIEARRLIENGLGNVNERGVMANTPLHRAARHGHKDVAELLIEKGADVNARNDNGETPLHLAARHGSIEVVRLLVSKGADLNAADVRGITPLCYAEDVGQDEIAAWLIAKGGRRPLALEDPQ